MATTYNRPRTLEQVYHRYAVALGKAVLSLGERRAALQLWESVMVDQDQVDDHYSDEAIEEVADQVEELQQDIEDAADTMADRADEVQDKFDDAYG